MLSGQQLWQQRVSHCGKGARLDTVGDELIEKWRHRACHRFEHWVRRYEDLCGGQMSALYMTHCRRFVSCDESKLVEMVQRPKVV